MILIKKCWTIFMLIVFSIIVGRAEASVQINATNFPDENFREYVKKEDTNKDNYLSNEEINSVVYMYISDEKIKDLKGVEFFTNLSFLSLF